MNNPLIGASYFVDGLKLITQRGIKKFVIIPLLINIVLFIALFFCLRHFMSEFNQWFAAHLPAWLQWLAVILWVLFFLSFVLFFVYAFVVVANIVAAPFNSFLAEKVELHLTGAMPASRTLWQLVLDFPRIIGRQLYILGYYLLGAVIILILFFVPIIQSIAPILWFLFHAWFLTMTYLDYPADNHRVPIVDLRQWMGEQRVLSLGFGLSVLVASIIPVLNFFAIPAAVAGATKFWLEAQSRR